MAHHLVIQLARFGDTIQTKRLLLSLAAVPGNTVHVAVDVSLASFVRWLYPFAVVHELYAHATNAGAAEVLLHNRSAFAALSEIPFDSVYNLNFSGMALALAGLFDADSVCGYSRQNGQSFRSRWFRMAFRWMGNRRIAPLNLVDFWAHLHSSPVAPSQVNPEAKSGGNGKLAVVAAGREARRSLPAEILAPLVESVFTARGGPEIVILGSNAERPFSRKLTRLLHPAVLQKVDDACGRTSLADIPAILAECDLVLTPDTGIMHLAAHLGIPVQAFFLSSAWCFETGPYGNGHTVIQATHSCAPCVETRPCPHGVVCLAPFVSPEVQRFVRGKCPKSWPENVVACDTQCDDFGCDYLLRQGTLPDMERRAALRALLAEYCGRESGHAVTSVSAEMVFHEADWMLPPVDASGRLGGLPPGE